MAGRLAGRFPGADNWTVTSSQKSTERSSQEPRTHLRLLGEVGQPLIPHAGQPQRQRPQRQV